MARIKVMSMKKILLLPAYNEEKNLPFLLENIRRNFSDDRDFEILVVDDGSSDGTKDIAVKYRSMIPLTLLSHKINRGLGEALKTGFEYINGVAGEEDIVITMDADGSHDTLLIPDMIRTMKDHDVMIASRYLKGAKQVGVGFGRRILSLVASSLLRLFFPIRGVRDYSCGFRAYRVSIIRRALDVYKDQFIQQKSFACMPEILIKLAAIGAKITEYPLILRYDLKKGGSKIRLFKTISGYFRLIITAKLLYPASRRGRN